MWKLTALAAVLWLSGVACGEKDAPPSPGMGCNLERELDRLAGAGASDCGLVRLGAGRRAADACLAAALRDRNPFQVRYELQGIDSRVVFGAAGSAAGMVTLFIYDGPLGFQGGDEFASIDAATCNGPMIRAPTGQPGEFPVECAAPEMYRRICE